MKPAHIWTIWISAVVLLLGGLGAVFWHETAPGNKQARQNLDRMLGQPPQLSNPTSPGLSDPDAQMQHMQDEMNRMMANMGGR